MSAMNSALMQSNLPLPVRRGKVRDVYDLGTQLLIVASDRISAYDVVMPNGIPDKGRILTAISLFWFEKFGREFENHLIASDVSKFPLMVQPFRDQLAGRSMLVARPTSSPSKRRPWLPRRLGWKEYQNNQTVCGIKLPSGLRQCDKLLSPSSPRHQRRIRPRHQRRLRRNRSPRRRCSGRPVARPHPRPLHESRRLCRLPRRHHRRHQVRVRPASRRPPHPHRRGPYPDSSRFWPADQYAPGKDQPSFDKQFVRTISRHSPGTRLPPPPRSRPMSSRAPANDTRSLRAPPPAASSRSDLTPSLRHPDSRTRTMRFSARPHSGRFTPRLRPHSSSAAHISSPASIPSPTPGPPSIPPGHPLDNARPCTRG